MPDAMQLWLTVATVGAAAAWLVRRFMATPSTAGCDRCAVATAPTKAGRGIRPTALRVLGGPQR